MGCGSCSSGGCGTGTLPRGCKNNGSCGISGCDKLGVFDWLAGLERPTGIGQYEVVEVRFKNTRKEFFKRPANTELFVGDVVAVEANSGHDVGVVSLSGELVKIQLQKRGINPNKTDDLKKVYRKAKQTDIDKWKESQEREQQTMIKARQFAYQLGLQMKISDVEFQGDGTKATFFYTADDRVDFRELIKLFAEEFKCRIEMRQIGVRQEAGRVGGIGSCGRELCCSTWLTDFRTVTTSAARYQQLSINPLKLAGQCGKLKCCLNFELDSYLDALKDFPNIEEKLLTEKGVAFHQKTDIFKRVMWYSYADQPTNFIPIEVDRVVEIIRMNKNGKRPADLKDFELEKVVETLPDYENVVGQDSLDRFDRKKRSNNNKRKPNRNRPNQGNKPQNRANTNNSNSGGPKTSETAPRNQSDNSKQEAPNTQRNGKSGKKRPFNKNRNRNNNNNNTNSKPSE